MSTTIERPSRVQPAGSGTDKVVALTSAGILVVFVGAALMMPTRVGEWVNQGFAFSAKTFGPIWQVLLLLTFAVAIITALTPWAKARLGGVSAPEYGRFQWVAMIMCTLTCTVTTEWLEVLLTPGSAGDTDFASWTIQAVGELNRSYANTL